jgi:putative multiple sugar transport system permease protein
MVLALIFILLFFTIVTGGMLLKPLNITNIILQNSYILMLSIGMLLIIVAGQIDLSVGSIVAFVGALMGVMTVENNVDPVLTIVILLVVGMGIGAWHGFWVAMFNIPSFIVTLGGSLIFRGLTLLLLRGSTLGPFPKVLTVISTGFIPDITDMKNINLLAVIVGVMFVFCYLFIGIMKRKNEKHYGFDVLSPTIFVGKNIVIFAVVIVFATVLALYKGIPNVLIILASVSVAYIFISKKTTIGRRVYAMGGNEMATRLSGINTKKLKFMVFVNMGLLAAIAAIIYTGRLNSANARAGQGFELDAIAACYIGGVSAMGGVGTIPGAILGTFVMGVLNNGMSLMGLGSDWQQVVKGVVLTLAVFYDVVSKKEAK